uniref:Kelch-like family member 38b n=1 Tax=Sinocyclocheilus rhinocerous TaxID=307959 RepID=A0A673K6H4_9TELE
MHLNCCNYCFHVHKEKYLLQLWQQVSKLQKFFFFYSLDEPISEVLHFKDKILTSTLLLELNTLRKDRILTDVVLCSEGKEIPCHCNVLVSSSPYFYAMFCSSFLETQKPQINLQGVPYDILTSMVEYVYTGSISITMELVLPLMQTASMLQYGRLFEACSTFLQAQLKILHCSSVREKARELAVKSFSDVVVSEDFCELLLPELVSYLEDDRLCVEEEQVFKTLLAWIHHDPFSRRGTIHDLFRRVRLRHVHPSYLFQFIAKDLLVQSSSLSTEMIESVRCLLFSVGTHCPGDLEPMWAAPRRQNCKEALVVVGGRKNGERTSREALLYDEQTHCWQWLAKVPLRLYRPAYVCMHSILYVLGGLTMRAGGHCTPSNTVYTLSLKTNQWRMGEPMLMPRYTPSELHLPTFNFQNIRVRRRRCHAETSLNDPGLIFQGYFGCLIMYHIGRNLWCRMETRTVKNVCAPAAVIDDKIYIVDCYTRRMVAYDVKTNRFEKCENMKARKMHHSATVVNDKIYVTGGRFINCHESVEDSDSFDCYVPTTDSWASMGTLPFKLFDHGSVPLVYLSDKFLPVPT